MAISALGVAKEIKAASLQSAVKVIKGPTKKTGFTLDDDASDYVKLLLFGVTGSGKTFPVGELAEMGYKTAIIATDFGDTGHLTVKNYLIGKERKELLQNVAIIPLEGWSEVAQFFKNPWKYEIRPGVTLGDFDPDVLMWDGFSAFQQIDVQEYVGDMQQTGKDGGPKERGEFRDSGLVLETQDWNAIRNATIRKAQDFLVLRKPDGRPVDKILTCIEASKAQDKDATKPHLGTVLVQEGNKPLVSGAGGLLMLAAFDVIGRTRVSISKSDATKGQPEYSVVFAGSDNSVGKRRGFALQPKEPANWKHIWGVLKKGQTETAQEQTASGEIGE